MTLSCTHHTLKVDLLGSGTDPMTTAAVDTSTATGTKTILVAVGLQSTGTLGSGGLTDNKGNTYTRYNLTTYAGGGGGCAFYYCANASVGTGHTWSLDKAAGYETNEAALQVQVWSDTDGGTPTISFTNNTAFTASITPTQDGAGLASFWLAADFTGGTYNYTVDANWTQLEEWENSNGYNSGSHAYRIGSGTGSHSVTWASTGSIEPSSGIYMVEVLAGGPPPQVAYPNADGTDGAWTPSTGADLYACIDETTPSDADYISTTSNSTCRGGLGTLSTPVEGTQTFAFRASGSPAKKLIATLIEAASTSRGTVTVDPLTSTVTEYTFSPSGITDYADLDWQFEIADATTPPTPSVSFGAIGTGVNGSTSINVGAVTGITEGDYLTLHVTSGATNSETPGTPSGWTLLATGASTDGTFGLDTGPRRATVFGKVAGASEGAVTVATTNGNTVRGVMVRWTPAHRGYDWDVVGQGANDSTSGTGVSMTTAAINWAVGDCACVTVGQRVDSATQSAQSLTASGTTFGTRTNRASTAVTTGNDHRHVVDTFAAVTTGGGSAATTWAYTASAAVSAGGVVVRLREVPPTEFGRVTHAKFTIPAAAGGSSHATSGVLTGQGASVSGSAVHNTLHATSGVLVGQGSSIVGTAVHYTLHAASGSLAGQGASISGSALRYITHTTSGELLGQGSVIAGAATHSTAASHDTTGDLTGQGAVISGTALRYRVHTSSGALSGQGSLIAGSALRYRQHPTSGTLAGQGSTISGTAVHSAPAEHAATGALTGQGSIISGVSLRYRQHATSGALSGQSSILSGTAAHKTLHATSGILVGQGATITGVSLRYRAFTSSGSLVGAGAIVSGVAEHTFPGVHSATGALVGQGAQLYGAATFTPKAVVGGVVPGKRKQERRILITLDGNRYLVPESELPQWVDDKAEEVVTQVLTRPVKSSKKVKKQKQERIPELVTKVDDSWVRLLIDSANNAIRAELEFRRQMDEDDVEILLMVA
jgi:hypothetical protein